MAKTIIKGSTKKQAGSRPPKPKAPVVQRCEPALSHSAIQDMIYQAAQKVLNRDSDRHTQRPSEPSVGNGRSAGTIGLEDHAARRPAMLPSAIDHLHNSIERLSDVIRQLEDKLESVLMPVPQEKDGIGVMACELAPAAVHGVREANERVQFHTAQIHKLIERLEA